MTAPLDPVTALERSYDELTRVIDRLGPDQLAEPTGCPDWDVRALLNHTFGCAQMYVAANEGRLVAEGGGELVGDDPALAVAETAVANLRSWREPGALDGERTYPFGTLPAGAGLVSNVGEVAVHAWDVANATGQPARIDDDVATLVLDFYQYVPMVDLRSHGVYGPEIAVPESASVADCLLGFLGRGQ